MTDASLTPTKPLSPIRATLQAEGAGIAVLCLTLYASTGAGWGLFALLILAPDLAMLGYLGGNRPGALCYNLAHSHLSPLALAAMAALLQMPDLLPLSLIWGAHIGLDRAIGYGLKYASGFKATHLARV